MRADLPTALYSLFPAQAAEARREGASEWSASCPTCGGRDRFRIFAANGRSGDRYWCRVCGLKGFMDGKKLTAEQIAEGAERRRAQREQERFDQERRIAQLREADYWRGYHDGMRDAARMLWRQRGLPDEAQDFLDLGMGKWQDNPALSIPFHNREWAVETVQYRLLNNEGQGRYRFEAGYPATAYWTRPEMQGWPFIICEGAIKSAVLFWHLVVEANRPYNVVALTGKTPGRNEVDRLGEELAGREVYLMLDPDATVQERARVGSHFDGCRYVAMPGKVDDMINDGFPVLTVEKVYLQQAALSPL